MHVSVTLSACLHPIHEIWCCSILWKLVILRPLYEYLHACIHGESELIFNNTQLLGWYIFGGRVILTGKPTCNGRKFCSIATLCTTNHTWTSTMLCELNFQSYWKKAAGQMQSGDVQMPSHHTAKKYESLEKWWKRICRHKNFRQLSVTLTVKFFNIKKVSFLMYGLHIVC